MALCGGGLAAEDPCADWPIRAQTKVEWELVETRMPLRLGKPLPLIPFVFHGPRHSLPDVDGMPLSDMIVSQPGPLPAGCGLQAWPALHGAADGLGGGVRQDRGR